jgi:hypothetical protein
MAKYKHSKRHQVYKVKEWCSPLHPNGQNTKITKLQRDQIHNATCDLPNATAYN